MNRPKVFIVKEQLRSGPLSSEPMDYSPAMAYGDLEFVTNSDLPMYPKSQIANHWFDKVKAFAQAYDESRDLIIATGSPTAIFNTGWVLGMYGKIPRYLVWRRDEGRYQVLEPFPAHYDLAKVQPVN